MNLTDGESKETQLVMTDRKGFVKISIENGLDIIPGFCFGEKLGPQFLSGKPGMVQTDSNIFKHGIVRKTRQWPGDLRIYYGFYMVYTLGIMVLK